MEVIRPLRQKAWGWQAAANFILGAAGSGFYLLSLAAGHLRGDAPELNGPAAFKIIAPLLTILGLCILAFEAGRPLRSRYLLANLRQSWMSREALAALLFVSCALLDRIFPHEILRFLAAAGAAGFLVGQGLLVYYARSVAAWNVPLIPLLFVSSGLATGGGVLLLNPPATFEWGAAALVLAIMGGDLAIWLLYLFRQPDPDSRRATQALRRSGSLLLTVGIGHLLPILLLLPTAMMEAGAPAQLPVLAGLCAIAGGAAMKRGIILQSGRLRGVELGQRKGIFGQPRPEEKGDDP